MNLKTYLTVMVAALLSTMTVCAKDKSYPDTISARRAFIEMPSGILDLLSKNTRLDMLDYYDNDSIYKAVNNLKGVSYLETVTPDFLSVKLTPASSLQLKVLPLKDGSQILMSVYTTGEEGAVKDSEIAFYDASLNPLPTEKFFRTPKLNVFFETKGFKTSMKEIEQMLPFYSFEFETAPETPTLKGRLSYKDAIPVEDAKIIELMVRPEVIFTWNGKEFR